MPQVCYICPLMLDRANSQNTNLWIFKFNYFWRGLTIIGSDVAALLRCWTCTESLVVIGSWTSKRLSSNCWKWFRSHERPRPLLAVSQQEIETYHFNTHLYKTTISLGLVSSGIFQKECCQRFFCTTWTALKAASFWREVGPPIFRHFSNHRRHRGYSSMWWGASCGHLH